jgi:hypothetical protein
MNAILTCVGYDDFLALTLAENAKHFSLVLVVTTPGDLDTARVVEQVENAHIYKTCAFHRDGAPFNKAAALDESLDWLGREGWICIMDADTLLPNDMDLSEVTPGFLHSPYRRVCEDPKLFTKELEWSDLPLGYETRNGEHAGYMQVFHADDSFLPDPKLFPWHGTEFKTAQGADTIFQNHWPRNHRKRLPFEVLHLGPLKTNWSGRVSPRWDVITTNQEKVE